MTVLPIDYVLIETPSAYNESLLLPESGLQLFLDPSYNKQDHVQVSGIIVSLPKNPKGESRQIINDLSIGNQVVFSYMVISDIVHADESEAFHALTEGSGHFQKWVNSKGQSLFKVAMPGVIGLIWAFGLLDRNGDVINGAGGQGSEHDADRFLSQFKFGTTDNYKFKRLIEIDGRDFWMVKADEIFAKKVGDDLIAIGDRVITEPVTIELTEQEKYHMGIQVNLDAQIKLADRGVVLSGGEELGINKGDMVSFDARYCEKYEFFGKEYSLIKKKRINGTWHEI